MKKELFGKTKSGETVNRYEISNSNGMKLAVSDYGATVLALFVKDKDGSLVDVALGYEDFAVDRQEGFFEYTSCLLCENLKGGK